MKIVINSCYGGFGLSEAGEKRFLEKSGKEYDVFTTERHDPILIEIIQENSPEYLYNYCKPRIVDFPDIFEYCYIIRDYDGLERISIDYEKWLLKHISLSPEEFYKKVREALIIQKRLESE